MGHDLNSGGIETWLLLYFMKRYTSITLCARLILPLHGMLHPGGILTSYSTTINHLLEEYSSDYIISETVDDIISLKQLEEQSAVCFWTPSGTKHSYVVKCINNTDSEAY